MDLDTFFNVNQGNWISQKTAYNPNLKSHTTKKGKVCINIVNNHSVNAKKILEPYNSAQTNIKSYSVNWGKNESQQYGLVIIPNDQDKQQIYKGKIHKYNKNFEKKILEGYFELENGVLKVIIKTGEIEAEERIWFVNSNLKLTNSIIKKSKNCINISFTSEIKIQQNI
uniref:hypothetical protein n=1 Tax=Pseudoerythrocladia kornmannii TaxID=753682 RepID=UPI001BED7EAA|nr:hypothetical protein MW575_pgp024 [Pseudoerythrocladia kornmannii]QUE28331.1 Ycf58 [Pseudoerythrocladia kornmannii]UNJ16836.1 hypothetical protein [Pseudoerythrocladia kornmannii]